jgi:hypothetical protein
MPPIPQYAFRAWYSVKAQGSLYFTCGFISFTLHILGIKSRRMRWVRHEVRMGETKNTYMLVGKSEAK